MSETVAKGLVGKCVWPSAEREFGKGSGREFGREFGKGFVRIGVAGVGLLSLLLAGCSQKSGVERVGAPVVSLHLHGSAYGGQQPVSGAAIQLYAVATTGDGLPSTPLLTQVVTSDANGEFTLAGDYQCPSAATLVYLTATGGNPGLPAGMTNPQLALMAALGNCRSLGSTTTINVNELTTVAAVWPLAPFMSSYSAIGSGAADAAALASAFTTAAIFANTAIGTVPGLNVPNGTTVPVAQINTLADALASCTNSGGGVAGDGSACGILFSAATPPGGVAPVNVIGAGMSLANNPTLDSSSLFSLVGGKGPFQPTLTSPPANLAVQLTSTSGGLSFSTTGLAFPAAYLNFPSMQMLTVTNNSQTVLGAESLNIIGVAAADFSVIFGQTCYPTNLAPGQSCPFQIGFTPTASGVRNAILQVVSATANSPQSIALSGVGLAHSGSSVTLSPSSLTFTLAGVPQPVTVTNNGMTPIAIGPINVGPLPNPIASETNNCGAVLAAQSICTIQVEALGLSYTSVDSPVSGLLTVLDSGNPGVGTISVNVPLTSEVSFRPVPINFGNVVVGVTSPANSSNYIFIENDDFQPPRITGSIVGPNASDFSVQLHQVQVESHQVNTFFVTFTPSGSGPRTATLVTTFGNVSLNGNGVPDGP